MQGLCWVPLTAIMLKREETRCLRAYEEALAGQAAHNKHPAKPNRPRALVRELPEAYTPFIFIPSAWAGCACLHGAFLRLLTRSSPSGPYRRLFLVFLASSGHNRSGS